MSTFFKTGLTVLNIVAFSHILLENTIEITPSEGESMLPTIRNTRDYLVINKFHKYGHDIRVGDVVSCIKPTSPSERVCKRVTGMPGDIILVDPLESSVLHNFREYLKDPSVNAPQNKAGELNLQDLGTGSDSVIDQLRHSIQKGRNRAYNNATDQLYYDQLIRIPEGHCWLTGDNLDNSLDSRDYGVVPLALITGKVIGSIYAENGLKPWTWTIKRVINNFVDSEAQ